MIPGRTDYMEAVVVGNGVISLRASRFRGTHRAGLVKIQESAFFASAVSLAQGKLSWQDRT